ncbi:anti-sigma factor family protein [Microvirga roseola]|uniref:anti-sigma factor family protein n=1 Tax=Microvirga roseola TaxID=2883126 RepID=UPI001E61BA9B|nr:anti-sigma factor [Microvirga roseola]
MSDPITETDLLAYVDDQLEAARRIEVEEYLARHPAAAAQVMADLKDRDALRLASAGNLARPPEATLKLASQLERGLAWRDLGLRLRRLAAVVSLIGFGWFAHGQVGLGSTDSEASPKPPAFVEDALHSHETALLRARMISQPEVAGYDTAEILAETGIRLPVLPEDWQVRDAQVFPSRDGHSIEIAIDAGDLGRVSLFAARVSGFDVIAPTLSRFETAKAAYWQTGSLAYALTGTGSAKAIERAANRLSSKLQ